MTHTIAPNALLSSRITLELATRPGVSFENASAFAPTLHYWLCDVCACYVLRCQLRLGCLFAETAEPDFHWIPIRLSVKEFSDLTQVSRFHQCVEAVP